MAFTITREDEKLPQLPLVVVIYADPGVGKTTLSFTANKPLHMDFDKGVQRAMNRKTTVGFDSWKDVEEFVNGGSLDDFAPKTIVCDTAGTMLDDFIGHHVMKMDSKNKQKSGSISLQGYGAMKDVFNSFVMKELRQRNIDLVIIAHVTESEDNGVRIKRPKLTGGSKDILIAKADLLGYMYMQNEKRVINFNPTDSHIGKNCANFPVIEIRDQKTDPKARTQLAEIIQQAKDHMEKETEAQAEALKYMVEFKSKIDQITDLMSLEFELNELKDLSNTYKIQAIQIISDKYLEIWETENIDPCETPDDYTELINKANEAPVRYQKQIKILLSNKAKDKDYRFDKESKKFVSEEKEVEGGKQNEAVSSVEGEIKKES